jgi:hypothetical protein
MKELSLHDRIIYHRAVEAVIWAMPLMNSAGMRQALIDAGANIHDVGYFNPMQDWRCQYATANNTTPYVGFYANVKDGPVVVEIPKSAADVGIFGTVMDFWNRPLADVGAAGRDRGAGANYLFVHKDYQGPLPLGGYVIVESRSYNIWGCLRPVIKDASQESLDKAEAFVRKIRIFPLAKADNPPEVQYVNLYGKMVNAIPTYDASFFERLHGLIQEEAVDEKDHIMMGMLKTLGIEKGVPYKVDPKCKAIFDQAAKEALQYMIELYHTRAIPPFYEGKKWTSILPAGTLETKFSLQFPTYSDYESHGILYYAVTTSVEFYGAASFYLSVAKDAQDRWLDGGKNYTLTVPPNAPARDFWSIILYNLETASYIKQVPKLGVASSDEGLQTNPDGSVSLYFGPTAPKRKEANWAPTKAGERWFCLFRFYGPEPAARDKSWQLDDFELVE